MPMTFGGSGSGLPQMSEREMFDRLLSEDPERGDSEPAIAAGIGLMISAILSLLIEYVRKARQNRATANAA